jgi:hypothetical protein
MPKPQQPIIHSYSFGEAKEIVNGQVVHDTSVKSEYNGKTLHVDKNENGKFMHYELKGKELKHLLKKKTDDLGLFERLKADYMGEQTHKHKKHTHKHKKHKHTHKKHKHTHKKHTHKKHKHSKHKK